MNLTGFEGFVWWVMVALINMANQTQWWLGLDVVDRRKFDDG